MTFFRTRPGQARPAVVKAADGTLVPLPGDPQQRLLEQQRRATLAAQNAGAENSQQAAGVASSIASNFGPQGQAIAAAIGVGSAVQGKINEATTDKNGFAETGTGASVARQVGQMANPLAIVGTIGDGIKNLNDPHMSTVEKIGSFIPGANVWANRGRINRAREKFLAEKAKTEVESAATQNQQSNYQGLAYAAQGGTVPTFAGGGGAPKPAPAAAPRYTIKNPSPQATQYYEQALPIMKKLIGQKHDEVYTDENGRRCTANSCLSFATTIQEQALGQDRGPRSKANLYNPEWTRTAAQQGWVPIPLDQARAGDRLQSWEGVDDLNQANPGLEKDADMQQVFRSQVDQRRADLGSQQLIANKYPNHMMVLSSGLTPMDEKGNYWGDIVQDGHEFTAADRARKTNVSAAGYVVYRYIGANGQPTNNAAQAVAMNPAAGAGAPAPAVRAQGGPVPTALRLIPRRTQLNFAQGGPAPKPKATPAAPLTEAFEAAQEAKYRAWVRALPPNHRRDIDPMSGNAHDYDYRRAFVDGVQAADNGHFTDKYKTPEHRTFSTESLYFNDQTKGQAGRWEPTKSGGNRWVPLDPKLKQPFEEDAEGRPVGKFADGGELPASIIADGALHSQRHGHDFKQDVTATGVPILQLSAEEAEHGRQLAELEKDELTMSYELTQLVNQHVAEGKHEELGRLVAEQLLTNTRPSKRYAKRLAEGGSLPAEADEPADDVRSLVMMGPDGKVQMRLRGEERIFSREHTREMVTGALEAERPVHFRNLGRRIAQMVRKQNERMATAA